MKKSLITLSVLILLFFSQFAKAQVFYYSWTNNTSCTSIWTVRFIDVNNVLLSSQVITSTGFSGCITSITGLPVTYIDITDASGCGNTFGILGATFTGVISLCGGPCGSPFPTDNMSVIPTISSCGPTAQEWAITLW